jgi:hypothetical protein
VQGEAPALGVNRSETARPAVVSHAAPWRALDVAAERDWAKASSFARSAPSRRSLGLGGLDRSDGLVRVGTRLVR